MSRMRVICDGEVVGSIERDHGYDHCNAWVQFRMTTGEGVAFALAGYQIDEERRPVGRCDASADAGYWVIEFFLDLPAGWLDRAPELPGWQAVRPARVIDLGDLPGLNPV